MQIHNPFSRAHIISVAFGMGIITSAPAIAQTQIPPVLLPAPSPTLPQSPPRLPPPDDLIIPNAPQNPPSIPRENRDSDRKIIVNRFDVVGSSVFSNEELAEVVKPFVNRPLSFAELLQARSAVTELYVSKGYITSGAFIPPQDLNAGTVKIQIVEGGIQEIKVSGGSKLNPDYVRSRLDIATSTPLNRDRLIEALQLLQINPLIASLSAELAVGDRVGQNILDVKFTEANSLKLQLALDNNRAPSVGSFRRRIQLSEDNLTGFGDSFTAGYSNTDGSNGYDLNYTFPINPYNGAIAVSLSNSNSNVIEPPFNSLDIYSNSTAIDLTYRQPFWQTVNQEFALGLTASYRESLASILKIPFPLSAGADSTGKTKLAILRFFQEYTQRSSNSVFALRSQFSLGTGLFGANINNQPPDGRFVAWRGQAQYVNLLSPDTLLLIRGDLQLADRQLVPLEQIGLGGQDTLRGYRQDLLFGDNGTNLSVELRLPIMRVSEVAGLLQLTPFIDAGMVWASSGQANPTTNLLVSTGLGMRWTMGDRLTARLDYGIPLVAVQNNRKTLQENGLYFSLVYNLF